MRIGKGVFIFKNLANLGVRFDVKQHEIACLMGAFWEKA